MLAGCGCKGARERVGGKRLCCRRSGELGNLSRGEATAPCGGEDVGQAATGEATVPETGRAPRPAERPARALARPRRTAALHGSSIRNAYVSYLRLFLKERYPDMFKKWLLGFLKNWSMFLRRETEMANPPCPSLEREEAVFSASGSLRVPRPPTWPAVGRASRDSPGPRVRSVCHPAVPSLGT